MAKKKSTRGKAKSINTGNLFDDLLNEFEETEAGGNRPIEPQSAGNLLRRTKAELRVFPKLKKLYHDISRELSIIVIDYSIAPHKDQVKRFKELKARFEREVEKIKSEKAI